MSTLQLLVSEEIANPTHGIVYALADKLGSGGYRDCWRHPGNRNLCIKVSKPAAELPENEVDFHYARHLARRGITSPHMPRVHGWAETDHGRGLVVELVQQPDGTPCPTLPDMLRSGRLGEQEAEALIGQAFDWLIAHDVVLADCGLTNFLIRDAAYGGRMLVFVDGLGGRQFGYKYWTRRTVGFLARRKAREFRAKVLGLLANKSSKLWVAGQAPNPAVATHAPREDEPSCV